MTAAPPLRIGVAGLGVVGSASLRAFVDRADLLAARAGRRLEVVGVCARNRGADRGVDLSPFVWFDDPVALATAPDVDLFVELIGGSSGPALDACQAALAAGRDVFTANKAMLAELGGALAAAAAASGAALKYEAAVAG
ncbi:MAG: homoserine dehydrogenase, partial [Pseudomonadota bacterium]